MVAKRQFKSVLFLILFTGGLYHLVFIQDIFLDLNKIEGNEHEVNTVLHVILYCLTFGLYSVVCYCYLGNRIHILAQHRGTYIPQRGFHYVLLAMSGSLSIVIWIASFFYLPVDNMVMFRVWLPCGLLCCGVMILLTWGCSLKLLTVNFNKLADSCYHSGY